MSHAHPLARSMLGMRPDSECGALMPWGRCWESVADSPYHDSTAPRALPWAGRWPGLPWWH